MTTPRPFGVGAAVLLTAVLVVACAVGTLVRGAPTPFWPAMFVVAALQSASALVELGRGRQISELLRGRTVARTRRRLAYEAAVVTLVGAGIGAITGQIWHSTSGCLADLPPDAPLGACGTLVTVVFGVPILALVAAMGLAVLRVAWGIAVAVAAAPVAAEAVTFYRSATHTGGQDPPIAAVATIAAAAMLVSWVATSPRIPPLIRLTAVVAAFAPIPIGALFVGS